MPRPAPFAFHRQKDRNAVTPELTAGAASRFEPLADDAGAATDACALAARVTAWRREKGAAAAQVIAAAAADDADTDTSDVTPATPFPPQRRLRVVARIRPVLAGAFPAEAGAGVSSFEMLTPISPYLFVHTPAERLGIRTGHVVSTPQKFDAILGPAATDDEIFAATVKPLLVGALERGERCIAVAFGQTGSGKTHTCKKWIEACIAQMFGSRSCVIQGSVGVSYFELRGPHVVDLLAERAPRDLRTDARGNVHVVGLSAIHCKTAEEVARAVSTGIALRATACTNSNAQSSRSHAICQFSFGQSPMGESKQVQDSAGGRLQLIDLAGSERSRDATLHTAQLITELQQINSSLGALKEAIRGVWLRHVCRTRHHVNYRASKLTHLLKPMFVAHESERTRVCFVACFAPLSTQAEHTAATAKYARQLREVAHTIGGMQTATHAQLVEAVQLFYLEFCPERATVEACNDLLTKFRGREKKLYAGLKKKYRRAPEILLHAQRAADAPVPPLYWGRKKVMKFVSKIDNGRHAHLAEVFSITGSQLYSLSIHDVIRKAGGGSSCAAFNSKNQPLFNFVYDVPGKQPSVPPTVSASAAAAAAAAAVPAAAVPAAAVPAAAAPALNTPSTAATGKEAAREETAGDERPTALESGRAIFEAFRKRVIASKAT